MDGTLLFSFCDMIVLKELDSEGVTWRLYTTQTAFCEIVHYDLFCEVKPCLRQLAGQACLW